MVHGRSRKKIGRPKDFQAKFQAQEKRSEARAGKKLFIGKSSYEMRESGECRGAKNIRGT
jgi:hypothetical protein